MKKIKNLAVAAVMTVLCAVMFVGCGEQYTDDNKVQPTPEKKTVRKLDCKTNRLDYNTSGAVQTRAISGTLDGKIDIMSYHKATWLYGADTIRHSYIGEFIVDFYDIKRTRYAHNIDIFKNPVITPQQEKEGILWIISFKDTDTHDFDLSALGRPGKYESTTYQVGDSLMALCQNDYNLFEMLDSKVDETTSPDDKYYAYNVSLYGQIGFEDGPDNKKTWMVNLLVLVPKGGPDIPIPEDKHDVISFEEVDKGYDLVNDSVNNRWIDLVKVLSDGSREPFPRVAFVSKNHLYAPEYQIKQVDDFDWKSSPMKAFDATPSGDWQKRENNIYVMPMVQSCATYTDKGTCIFNGDFDGQAYFVDSLNQKHYFLYKEYSFEADDYNNGWKRSDMEDTENFERKLLSSDIRGLFNGATLPRTGKIELRKVKSTKKVIGPWYSPLESEESGLKYISEGVYETFRTKYLLFSDNTKELVGRVPIKLYLSATAPNKDTIDVTDWNITDVQAQPFDPRRQKARNDTTSYGVAKITPFLADFKTKTNKSTSPFTYTYDGAVVLIDPDTKEEIEFIPLTVKPEDLGGVRTLKDLLEEDDYERKSMTTSIKVTETHTSTFITKEAEILFRKAIEKEELISWEVKKDLIDKGNGLWDTKADIIYTWKLKGTEHDPITQELDCSLKGEAKTHVILDKAEAPFKASNFNGAWSGETSSNPQQYVTLYTKTKSLSEDYTNLTDRYTAKMQRAVIKKTVGGKEIVIDMLAPSDMTFTHNEGSLVDGKRTTKEGGIEYDVYEHTGSVTATVTGNGKSQSQTAKDEKEIWVKHEAIIPEHPEWGKPVKIIGQGTFVYRPAVGPSGQGVFHENFNVLYEKGVLCLVTGSYVANNYTNPMDFQIVKFYPFGTKLRGATITKQNATDLNSAIWRDNAWEPALCSVTGDAWTYMSPDGRDQGMTQQLAETCGLKNFTGQHTAYLQPWLYFSSTLSNGVLYIKNSKGGTIMSLR